MRVNHPWATLSRNRTVPYMITFELNILLFTDCFSIVVVFRSCRFASFVVPFYFRHCARDMDLIGYPLLFNVCRIRSFFFASQFYNSSFAKLSSSHVLLLDIRPYHSSVDIFLYFSVSLSNSLPSLEAAQSTRSTLFPPISCKYNVPCG